MIISILYTVNIYFKNRYTVHDCNYRWFDLIMKT